MRIIPVRLAAGALAGGLAVAAAACGDEASGRSDDARAAVVVTTSVLGDVVANVVGDAADVEVVMPPGADPHDFAPSARQVAAMRTADAVVVNGLGFEEGLVATIESVAEDGVPVFETTAPVDLLPFDGGGHGDDEDDGHGHGDDDGHGDEGDDPHFFTDPARMATAVEALAGFLAEHLDGADAEALHRNAEEYVTELEALDEEVDRVLSAVPSQRRVLITNHDVFGYFADRYDFEILATVIPTGTTLSEPSAAELARLAGLIEAEGVRAVFADTSAPDRLAETLAGEVGHDVEVVSLFTESLGPEGSGAETYIGMVRTNASLIAGALG